MEGGGIETFHFAKGPKKIHPFQEIKVVLEKKRGNQSCP
jgi:hypothetical protein